MTHPATDTTRVRHIVGCMTGTSLDGLDCALVRITGTGLDMTAEYVGMVSRPFDDAVRAMLQHLAEGNPAPPIDYMRAARMLGVLHADAVAQLLASHPIPDPRSPNPDFVVAHGQTIWHAPQDTLSWQLFDPWPLVKHLGVPVCYDLRQADLIAGGQGAPITPIADWVMYPSDEHTRLVLNLGGIANGSLLNRCATIQDLVACDIAPCNLLIDGMVRRRFPDMLYDNEGRIADKGRRSGAIYAEVGQKPLKCATGGREQFSHAWIQQVDQDACDDMPDEDAVSASVEAVAMWLIDFVATHDPSEVVLAGGGARNCALVRRLRARSDEAGFNGRWTLSDDLGIPCEAREAMAFAVLGALSQDGVPITLPRVTGSKEPGVAGCWVYP